MAQTFYDNSVASYLQTLGGARTVLERGVAYSEETGKSLEELVNLKLRDDMAPLSFQVVSIWHHSMGAMKGMEDGLFGAPPKMGELTYAGCQALVDEAIDFLTGLAREDVDALTGKDVTFRMGEFEMPFTSDNFLASFSLPNFYFHATVLYAILRAEGVPLGKLEFLGQMRMNTGG